MNVFQRVLSIVLTCSLLFSCEKKESDEIENPFFSQVNQRSFQMGFTTWSYGPTLENVLETYDFIKNNSDIYTEQFDNKIPWNAWINDTELPLQFTQEVAGRAGRRFQEKSLVLAVSLLNESRSDLANDFDDSPPDYNNINDQHIEDAYFKHLSYLIDAFQPDYLFAAIEVNELKLNSPDKWNDFLSLFESIKTRIEDIYPSLSFSASISIHNIIQNQDLETSDIFKFINEQDFAGISYYPYLHNALNANQYESTFELLQENIKVPIAFSETGFIAEDLDLPNFNLYIQGSQETQNTYLEMLLNHAQNQEYLFVTWFAHRDFDALWDTFPPESQDLGKVWRDTRILDESGNSRLSRNSWGIALQKK